VRVGLQKTPQVAVGGYGVLEDWRGEQRVVIRQTLQDDLLQQIFHARSQVYSRVSVGKQRRRGCENTDVIFN